MLGGSQPFCLREQPLDGEGRQKKAFELSLKMADCHLEERGVPSEGKGKDKPRAVVCGSFEGGLVVQSGQTTEGTGDEAGEVDRSQFVGSH